MSKINSIRIINLNYNYNGIRIDDETFHLGGESTLLSLRNGGGKSVLVQMLIAPFVHKRYRDSKDRKFSSYFTTNKPTLIMVEWKLDGNSGYVLTGMMVRKSQEIKEDDNYNDLDIIQFIHEYRGENQYDIKNIPFIDTNDDNMVLKSFSSCKALLESLKLDKSYKFYLYDMNNSNSARNYYDKLEEYQIYYKEWESIVKKVNYKESGLSELFINAKDEAGLIEGWFLPAIEDKLNKGKNRIDEFRDILSKYIKQYKDNKSKIDQKDIIILFKEETKGVLELAEVLKLDLENKACKENHIANLIMELSNLKEILESEKVNLIDNMNELDESIKKIEYEELSFKIYGLEDEKQVLENKLVSIEELIDKKDSNKNELTKKKNIQICAKIYKSYKDASRDVQEQENRLEIKKEKDKDRAPERDALGYTLKCHYENEKSQLESEIKSIENKIKKNKEIVEQIKSKKNNLENKEKEEIKREAELETLIKSYDEAELKFNRLYNEDLRRNMLQEYEDESLNLKLKRLCGEIEKIEVNIAKLKTAYQDNLDNLKDYSRMLQEKESEKGEITEAIKGIEEKIKAFDSELEERKTIIRYIELTEDKLFKTEDIITLIQKKKDKIGSIIKDLEGQLEGLKKEYNRLKSGRTLELPKDFEEALDNEGLHFVYGMEWLKRNNKNPEENKALVENNPFIPYSLIMSELEINSLRLGDLNIYTSFPIPIVKRESLEMSLSEERALIQNNHMVNFYILFNNNLLDEVELQRILDEIQGEIDKIAFSIETRDIDLKNYDTRLNTIKYQKVNERDYNNIKKELQSKENQLKDYEEELRDIRHKEFELNNLQNTIQSSLDKSKVTLDEYKRKQADLKELCDKYETNLKYRKDKIIATNNIAKIKGELKLIVENMNDLGEFKDNAQDSRRDMISRLKDIYSKYQQYSIYKEAKIIEKDIEDAEAKFIALTTEINSELKDIEQAYEKAKYWFKEYEDELTDTSNKLKIKEEEYIDEIYDKFLVETYELEISRIEGDLKYLRDNKSDLKTKIAVKGNEISTEHKSLQQSSYADLMPRNEIIITDFRKRKEERHDELKSLRLKLEQVDKKLEDYSVNLSNLAEYSELSLTEKLGIDGELKSLNRDGLDKYRGTLIRDYRNIKDDLNKLTNQLSLDLDKVLRNEAFKDDFFRRPLNTLSTLIENPVEFIEQLGTTIKAYDDLMAKLEVDIAMIEKEKERVIEMLLEYVEDIHKNIGKIDKNSSIKIRDRSIKMLRINQPDWENELYSYRTRLKDMIENLTISGINRLDNNDNIDELISISINTKNLYNTVVGINNVEIKLYKIEAEREVPIKWAEVAKNSGGEGFLSAFVVLSSLLSFMRRDETDIFAEIEEGKVLLMDNPFAQTNSSHLLNPLMDIANKSNTQLVCFTGLGGESIYNCFDNIYVLNLISSKLRKGMQYLKGEHTKGEDYEAMVTSQVKTEDGEQMGFLF